MLAEIVGVIAVPAAGDPGRLLAPGFGLRVPPAAVHRWNIHGHCTPWERGPGDDCDERALPLWWNNEIVTEGWDRIRRAMPHHALVPNPDAGQVRWTAIVAKSIGRVSRVIHLGRDALGRMVELEDQAEVTP